MLSSRLLVAVVALPPVLFLAYIGGWPLAGLLAVVAVVGTVELRGLLTSAGVPAFWPAAFVAAPLLVLDALLPGLGLTRLVVAGVLLAGLVWALFQSLEPARAIAGWAATLAAPLYLGLPLGLALALRFRDDELGPVAQLGPLGLSRGALWLGLALLATWACDTSAYFVGRALGRRPFFQRISPRKTAEGTAGGLLAAALAGVAFGPALGLPWLSALALGALAGAAAVFGDLAESLLKRAGGAKDSGRLFPGHGGMLDRLDSLLFVFVVVYYGGQVAQALASH